VKNPEKQEGGRMKAEGGSEEPEKQEGGRMKAEGGRMKAEGGRMKAEGGRMKAEGGGMKAEGGSEEPKKLPRDLRERTTEFAPRVVRMYCALPKTAEAQVLGKQALRSGTSVGAHYREASRARSKKEFVSKLEGGLAELEETAYWLELLAKAGIVSADRLQPLRDETSELIRILVASARTAKQDRNP
jgi:four helix bundle protein